MTDESSHDRVLQEILNVLERIEAKLDKQHEQRSQSSEGHLKKRLGRQDTFESFNGQSDTKTSTLRAEITEQIDYHETRPSRKGTPTNEDVTEDNGPRLKIPYSQWSLNRLDRFFNFTIPPMLLQRLGDCWGMPDDNRLPLRFFKSNTIKANAPYGVPVDGYPSTKPPIERDLDFCCNFDETLRTETGNDFMVVDFDTSDNTRLYRLGKRAVGSEFEIDPQGTHSAPWSRFILYQGASTGNSIRLARNSQQSAVPYFTSTDKIVGLWDHLDYHLQTKRRGTTTNPYLNVSNGFHTSFFEVHEVTEWNTTDIWKHGPLYGHPLGWHFKKCSYTIYAPVFSDAIHSAGRNLSNLDRHWTLLVLSPNSFFNDKQTSFPMSASSPSRAEALGYVLGKLTRIGAELHLIGLGLERITHRWADFLTYFDYILDGGDSLMKPAEHDNLLFDDGAFSRSRRYFWAIDCLSEFELSITDNIIQWELYKAAKFWPDQRLPDFDDRQFVFVERQYRVLQNQRESFRQKLASTKALRDALFNASAVIESRASTRLGENVKLLTFVSIFFLPLAFTTSLWSVNDQFSMTTLIYVIIIVALLTYLTMFNINSIAQGFGRVYSIKKKRIVHAMKKDHNESWKVLGNRFEVFRPKHETPEPSEWLIALYTILHSGALVGFDWISSAKAVTTTSAEVKSAQVDRAGSKRNWFRRRQKPEEPEERDEPWVIG